MASRRRLPISGSIPRTDSRRQRQAEKAAKRSAEEDDEWFRRRAERKAQEKPSKRRSPRAASVFRVWSIGARCWACGAGSPSSAWWSGSARICPIQSLEIPKRPPTIEIIGRDGSMLAQRGDMAGANVSLKDLPPYLPKAFIAIEDRRFYSHYGVDPWGILRAAVANLSSRRLAGRLDPDAAACQEPVPDPGAHACAQTAGSRARAVAGAQTFQGRDPRALSEPRLFRLRRLWRRGRRAALFRQAGKSITLPEAAMLAGLVNRRRGLRRTAIPKARGARQTVLAAMADAKFITEAQAQASMGHPAISVKPVGAGTVNYVADWIGEVLDDLVGQVDQIVVEHHRSEAAERCRSRRDRRACGEEREVQCQPGRAGGDDTRRRRARHGRRAQLWREPL